MASASDAGDLERLKKRYGREQRARQEAEAIAERVTAELYASAQELARLNVELKHTNDQLQAVNQAMRDFVAIASHDLRSPLTSILGFSELLMRRSESLRDEQKSEFLNAIHRQGEHLNRLVEDLLTVSKIEAGALDVHCKVVELAEALHEAIADFRDRAAGVTVLVPPHLTVVVDPDHLSRIVTNFVSNALKYGEPPVEIVASDANDRVEIRVRDNGPGIPDDFVPRLFGRFARADNAATRAEKGTGLGLSIVQGLAQANGGDTWYEPNTPHGSVFAVRLPKAAG
jgi:signal transduction histidine kinase